MAKERILIVEDEVVVAEDLRATLMNLGYQVVGVADRGTDAMQIVEKEKPDLVLMDIRIKGDTDGVETAENIVVHHDIPVVYLTAYADEETLERAKATLPYGYILKPFDERDVKTTLQIALYKHGMQKMLNGLEPRKTP